MFNSIEIWIKFIEISNATYFKHESLTVCDSVINPDKNIHYKIYQIYLENRVTYLNSDKKCHYPTSSSVMLMMTPFLGKWNS